MSDPIDNPVLVIGGTGKTGRRVADRLTAHDIPVRIGSRQADPPFDWSDRSTWAAALEGARAAYITYYPDIALPGAVETIEALVTTAMAHGVDRLVLLTGRGEEEAERAEEVLKASGARWTIVRASWFAQNFSENFFADGIAAGEVVFPSHDVGEPFVDADDIADVVTAALTEDGHVGNLYEVTGPRLLTFPEAVAEIARASGRDISYVPVSVDDYIATLKDLQIPPEFVDLLDILTRQVLDGRNSSIADGVERALGRPPRDFSVYAAETARSGVWAQAA
ncbi:NAD(P)H-binding protein [Amorphus orientalis]|uniref:Uncharacterized protein YbjT (DUF2867 family) n=1 Tax=Amorphus orientalis TaxID=649198 RepID=A0AAE4ASJ6_9HYPH|nr:NAD(P)H-binding protein [Amorphus orientalis]MDQ0314024.1 uncharacterized protein YbjT (DUF2867 family) [Amorphus orientalis]